MGLHCSHFYKRRKRSVRWDASNCVSLCFGCHGEMESNPPAHTDFILNLVGQGMYDILTEKMNTPRKVTKKDEKEIAAHYRQEFRRMEKLRESGEVGRIEFLSYQ